MTEAQKSDEQTNIDKLIISETMLIGHFCHVKQIFKNIYKKATCLIWTYTLSW